MVTFRSLRETADPDAIPDGPLRALWYDLQGDWDTAHRIVQVLDDHDAMWVHAYLHRKEPDINNAKYWYRRCGEPYPGEMTSDAEAEMIVSAITARGEAAA